LQKYSKKLSGEFQDQKRTNDQLEQDIKREKAKAASELTELQRKLLSLEGELKSKTQLMSSEQERQENLHLNFEAKKQSL
jgi:Skp family chaperone for outer membrane proteins